MEVLAYLQGCHIGLPCSISSRKLLICDPPSERPGKAASWTFGIISYFTNGLNSHSWGQLEGLLDLIMLEREGTRNILHWARETAGREQASIREMWWDVSHAAQAEGLKPCSTRETKLHPWSRQHPKEILVPIHSQERSEKLSLFIPYWWVQNKPCKIAHTPVPRSYQSNYR